MHSSSFKFAGVLFAEADFSSLQRFQLDLGLGSLLTILKQSIFSPIQAFFCAFECVLLGHCSAERTKTFASNLVF